MELWCGEQFVVGILCTGRLERRKKGRNEASSRSSSVSRKYHSCFDLWFDIQIACELVVDFQESLVGGRVCKCCSMDFPRSLRPLSERLTALRCCTQWLYLEHLTL